jgi:phage-related protein
MPNPAKRLEARFYETHSGRQPVREWLLDLSAEDRKTAGTDIAKVEFGWPVGLPSCRPMKDGLYEVRSNLSGGRIGRVLFGIAGGSMVLLHGFIKKTQATPKADLDLARKRLKEVQ